MEVISLAKLAQTASRKLANISAEARDAALWAMARGLLEGEREILAENARDLKAAESKGLSRALIDRLTLNIPRIESMAQGIEEIAALPDPIHKTLEFRKRPNGLKIKKVQVPIGVIAIIYESRPNVTADAAALCIKSGNSIIMRGGTEAIFSNTAIWRILSREATRAGIPEGAIGLIETADREAVKKLLKLNAYIDLVIPRGGEGLIKTVMDISTIPVLKHYKGICHTYIDKEANLEMALKIAYNAKVQRPGVCNAMETLLVHRDIADSFLPPMVEKFTAAGVELRGDARIVHMFPRMKQAKKEDWSTEYLDLILSIKIVDSPEEAIEHIYRYGSGHSEAIVTENETTAQKFLEEVDAACIYHNASTRFTDGGEFGLGAEMGISTDKLHARGPVGVEELTTYKYMIYGDGQVRK